MINVMIQILTGENSFLLRQALVARTDVMVVEYGDMAVERLDASEVDVDRIREALQSAPFFTAKKLLILSGTTTNKPFMEQAEKLLGYIAESTDVIITEPKLDKRSIYYKLLKRTADMQEFMSLDEAALPRWLVQIAAANGGKLSPIDARLLVERVGTDQQLLFQEVAKLALYRPHITRDSIELLTDAAPQSQIFDLIDAAFRGDTRRALNLYRDQREQRVDPAQIIALLVWQLRTLALVLTARQRSDQEIAQSAKISPYIVQKTRRLSGGVTLRRLKQLVYELLTLDVRSKREKIDLDEALQNYILLLAS